MHGDISMGHLAKPMGAVGLLQGMTLQRDRTHMSWLALPEQWKQPGYTGLHESYYGH